MKTTYILISILVSLFYLPLHAGTYTINQNQTISLTTGYVDNMSETWNVVSTVTDKPLKINYTLGTEQNFDFVTIYSVDNSGVLTKLTQLSGTQTGSISAVIPNGKAQITFTSDGNVSYASNPSLYSGLNISFSVDNSTIISDNLYVSGSVQVGTTYKMKLMDWPGSTSWIDMPAVVGKASGIGSGGAGSDAWVGYAGLANQWFMGSKPGDICYRNSNGRLIFGNLSTIPVMAISGSNVGIGTLNTPSAKLEVFNTAQSGHLILSSNDNASADLTRIDLDYKIANTNQTIGRISSAYYSSANGGSGALRMYTSNNGALLERLRIDNLGNVGIGTAKPDTKLTVNGKIHATEVIVDLAIPADYVFKPTYKLMPLNQVEQFVKTNSHLPEIPSANEITKNGLSMGEMQNKLLQKVEELTLYVIEQQKEINQLKQELKR